MKRTHPAPQRKEDFIKAARVLVALMLVFGVGCHAASHQVVTANKVPFRTYGTVTVSKITANEFWAKNPDLKNDEKWTYQVNRAADIISTKLTTIFTREWKGETDKELRIEAGLFQLNPGSRVARYFVGAAGEGKVGYHVKLRDAATSEIVGQIDAFGTLSTGWWGGNIGTAYDQCADAIIEYAKANR